MRRDFFRQQRDRSLLSHGGDDGIPFFRLQNEEMKKLKRIVSLFKDLQIVFK